MLRILRFYPRFNLIELTIELKFPSGLPTGVVSCGDGWYSKITSDYVNAVTVCTSEGYSGTITQYGGNYGWQCYRSTDGNGELTNFGYAVSWQCAGAGE